MQRPVRIVSVSRKMPDGTRRAQLEIHVSGHTSIVVLGDDVGTTAHAIAARALAKALQDIIDRTYRYRLT